MKISSINDTSNGNLYQFEIVSYVSLNIGEALVPYAEFT